METLEKIVLENITKIRQSQKVTKRQMASWLNMSEGNYGRIEKGEIALLYQHLVRIASYLKCEVIDVITYPDVYEKKEQKEERIEPVEAVLQIKLSKDKKDQVLKLVFGENNVEILNK